jgi:hypothetical protein
MFNGKRNATLPVHAEMTIALSYDEIRATQPPADSIRGSLVVGFMIEGLADPAAFTKLHAFAKERSLELFFGGGDAENQADEHIVSLYPWILGKEIFFVKGGPEQERGFEYKAGGPVDAMMAELGARTAEVEAFGKENGLTVGPCELRLVARGGLALALLLKGEWLAAPDHDEEDDPDASLYAWLDEHREPSADPRERNVGFRHGTKGSSQDAYPGGVRGICIAGADSSSEPVTLSAAIDAELDSRLAAAGIAKPRYFIVTRYD